MRLFSAFVPPPDVVESLRVELAALGAGGPDEMRWTDPDEWHVTLGFYGDVDDPSALARSLRERLASHAAPRLRITGAGTFPGILLLAMEGDGLAEAASAAGAGDEGREYRPHLTLGRWPRDTPAVAQPWVRRLSRYRSESWTASEAVLMRTERGTVTPRYRVLETFPLG